MRRFDTPLGTVLAALAGAENMVPDSLRDALAVIEDRLTDVARQLRSGADSGSAGVTR